MIRTYLSPRLRLDTSFNNMFSQDWLMDFDYFDLGQNLPNYEEQTEPKPQREEKESKKFRPFISFYECEVTVNELRKRQKSYLYFGLGPFVSQ